MTQEKDKFLDQKDLHKHKSHSDETEIEKNPEKQCFCVFFRFSEPKKRKEDHYKSKNCGLNKKKRHQELTLQQWKPLLSQRCIGVFDLIQLEKIIKKGAVV